MIQTFSHDGNLQKAESMFERMPHQNVVTWLMTNMGQVGGASPRSSQVFTQCKSSAKRREICATKTTASNAHNRNQSKLHHLVKIGVQDLRRVASDGTIILSGVSLEIKAGTIHGLIGPSGSGKSTVLRALNRLWEPPARAVFLDGADITKVDAISLRRRVGMVFQSASLFPGSVADNVRYGPSLRGRHLSDEDIEELLIRAGVTEPSKSFMLKSGNELSGGEAQRVSIARTLANEPEVLLLDEPTSALDPLSTRMVENTVMELKRAGLTVVLVSHNMQQVERIVDVASVLFKGSVLETGTLEQLKQLANPVLKQFLTGELH